MDHVIPRRLAQVPSAAARPFVLFAALFMSGLRLFRPAGPDQSAPAPTGEVPGADETNEAWATAVAEESSVLTCEPTIPTVPVTFTLPGEVGAGDVALCADFNGWTAGSIPL
ncbi:MAG TPA: hypothetical protein VGD68_08770, partial [Streptosporangiaceae bacterium]